MVQDTGSDISSREFEFKRSDFERIRGLIYEKAGISLSDSKREMVYSRISRRLRAKGLQSFGEYLDFLGASQSLPEWQEFINCLTTNLTSFFREHHHFPILEERVRNHSGSPLSIWCSASSTGEEPYSIAMTVCEALGTLSPSVKIIASDIDTNVLNQAEKGIYPLDQVQKSIDASLLRKYFLKGKGGQEGYAIVRPELRRMINFRRINLLDQNWGLEGAFDIIFCRNVMIYFDKETQKRILDKFSAAMKSDGLLFAGHSENFTQVSQRFVLRGKTVYAPVQSLK